MPVLSKSHKIHFLEKNNWFYNGIDKTVIIGRAKIQYILWLNLNTIHCLLQKIIDFLWSIQEQVQSKYSQTNCWIPCPRESWRWPKSIGGLPNTYRYTIVLNQMFSGKKKIFETSFLFRGLSFYGAGCNSSSPGFPDWIISFLNFILWNTIST